MTRILTTIGCLLLITGAAGMPDDALAQRRGRSAPKAAPKAAPPEPAAEGSSSEIQRGERIEFDERLIQGQTAKAGALYLFDRKPSDLRSMVSERESYRAEIVREVFPAQEEKP